MTEKAGDICLNCGGRIRERWLGERWMESKLLWRHEDGNHVCMKAEDTIAKPAAGTCIIWEERDD